MKMANNGNRDFQLKSPVFYDFANVKVDYPTKSSIRPIPLEQLKEGLRSIVPSGTNTITFYDRIGDDLVLKNHEAGGPPGIDVAVKLIGNFGEHQGIFFFVFKSFGEKLKDRREWLKDYAKMVDDQGGMFGFKVKSLLDVGVGHLLGLDVGGDSGFVRVRSTTVDILTGEVGYWAVDEGFSGTCAFSELHFLMDDCCALDMLVVPGKFASPPTPAQITKLKEGKYAVANVLEPCVRNDFGARIVRFD